MAFVMRPTFCELVRHPDDPGHVQFVGPDGLPDVRATDAARHFETYVGKRTAAKYLRGATAMMATFHRRFGSSFDAPSLWDEPAIVSTLWHDLLRAEGFTPKWSTRDRCYHITVNDSDFDRLNVGLTGMFTLYEAARDRHLYDGVNPMAAEASNASRRMRRTARSLFRLKRAKPRTMRVMVPDIVERVRRAGRRASRAWPAAVTMLIDLMIEGLARLSEQIALTLEDWWLASEFGEKINTPNKGDDFARTKVQVFSAALAARLRIFVNETRVDLPELTGGKRRSLDDFRRIAAAGDLETLRREPLFTNSKGGFFSQSGVADYYFRPAMDEAGLHSIASHALRHAGTCAFFAWVKELDIPASEKESLKLEFGDYMGWKWPESMLEHYSEVERRNQATETAIRFLQTRRHQLDELERDSEFEVFDYDDPIPAHNDADLERLAMMEAA